MRKLLIAGILLPFVTPTASAGDFVVSAPGSIQAAIDLAVDGDRVLVQPGVYLESLDFSGKAIQVIGLGGATLTTLDAGGSGSAVRFLNGEGATTRLAGFSITGGSSGGIVTSPGSTPTVEDCDIHGNVGLWGGGVHGDAILVRCTIRNNHASTGNGGGVWGTPIMEDCLVLDNTVTSGAGGGVYVASGAASLRGCRIQGNSAVFGQGRGGGIYVNSPASALIERCLVLDNFGSAGAFAALGGGIFVEAAGTTVVGCTLVGNSLNGSSEQGGAIYGPVQLRNSIVRGNDAPALAAPATVSYSNVQGGFAGVGNIDADPLFASPATGDFELLAGSPCVDAGDPADAPDANGSRVDMGALPHDLPAPAAYCQAVANSTGSGAHIGWSGGQSVTTNDFVLQVSGLPAGQPGLFFYGPARTQVPFVDGLRCVDGGGLGLFRLNPPQPSSTGGTLSRLLDFGASPAGSGPGAILPGSTWNFQFWYRDPLAAGTGSNTTDALRASFVP